MPDENAFPGLSYYTEPVYTEAEVDRRFHDYYVDEAREARSCLIVAGVLLVLAFGVGLGLGWWLG